MIQCPKSAEITLRKPCALPAVLSVTMTFENMRCLLRRFSRVGALAVSGNWATVGNAYIILGNYCQGSGSPKDANEVIVKILYRPCPNRYFLLCFLCTDSLQEIRVELAPARAVEAAQVAVYTQKTMMMTCMAKW